jgi:hypothetical protein
MPEKLAFSLQELNAFIVTAKAATYVGGGEKAESCRPGSHDLIFEKAPFFYLDSYFGGSDFIGQEVVYYKGKPVWAMNYYGHILAPDLIIAAEAGKMIKESLSKMYAEEERFLGGFEHVAGDLRYTDTSQGEVSSFMGKEWIARDNVKVYELDYHGGLIKD